MKVRYIHFAQDEWLAGCVGLYNAERGLYITACALIYSHGGSVPVAELKAACRDHGRSFNHQLKLLLDSGKLSLNEGQISNKRCVNELEKVAKWAENKREKSSKIAGSEAQNNPQSHKDNGLGAPHAHASAPAPPQSLITNPGLDLSKPQEVRERSKPPRLRAREGALEGASHASAASNHQSEAATEAEKEARRQEGLQQALAMMPEYDAILAANEAEAKAAAEARWTAEEAKWEADKKRLEELAINRAAEAEWRAEERAKREGRPWPSPPEPEPPPILRVVISERDQKFSDMAAWVELHMKDTDPRRPIWLKDIEHARATGDDTLIDDWDRLCQIQQAEAAE